MTDTEGEASLEVSITGAGPAHAELREADGGVTEVLCTARTAGDYVLSVYDLLSGAALFGSPYKVSLSPAERIRHEWQEFAGLFCCPCASGVGAV